MIKSFVNNISSIEIDQTSFKVKEFSQRDPKTGRVLEEGTDIEVSKIKDIFRKILFTKNNENIENEMNSYCIKAITDELNQILTHF